MRCIECKQPVKDFWEFCEGIVCEDCVLDDPVILHKYNLYLYDENGKKIGSDEKKTNITIEGTDYVIQTINNGENTEVQIPFFPIDIRKYHFDVFVLNNHENTLDVVRDFEVGEDVLEYPVGLTSEVEITSSLEIDDGNSAVISFDGNTSAILRGVNASELEISAGFIF